MAKNTLIDTANIKVKAGNGGDGRVSFKRAKFLPKGGPDGGDGGKGGNIVFRGDNNLVTLMDFRSKQVYKAEDGEMGGKEKRTGKNSPDTVIRVPLGTIIYQYRENDDKVVVADIVEDGQEFVAAYGGSGGKGNVRFKSSTNQAPEKATPGRRGEEKDLVLEIKLIADVGLVGFPNAGKSTLMNSLAGTSAKTANYPFTTLSPNLGVLRLKNGQDIVIADIPGLIEGASSGKGLGDEFLRHIERTRLIVHVIDPTYMEDPLEAYEAIRKELDDYSKNLLEKEEIVVVNKIDLLEIKENFPEIQESFKEKGLEVLGISALTGEGTEELINKLTERLQDIPKHSGFEAVETTKIYTIDTLPNKRIVFDK